MDIFHIKKKVKDIKRFEEILALLAKEEFDILKKNNSWSPKKLRLLFEKLGPTFIKLGQLLSLRPDLIPVNYSLEFTKLQDEIKSFPYSTAKSIIESQLKLPLNKIFKDFSKKPISAASISQVHQATLLSGESVAVKVQRPSIKEIMESDIDIMELLTPLLQKKLNISSVDLNLILEEFRTYTERELDFRFELRNLTKFYDYFKSWDNIVIPKTHEKFSSKFVLTMEFIDGIKLNQQDKIRKLHFNEKLLALTGFKAVFYQIFDFGLFHADPHPANLMALKPNKIAFLDFGIVGYLSPEVQGTLLRMTLYILENNPKKAIQEYLKISSISKNSDIKSFTEKTEYLILDWHGSTFQEMRFTTLLYEMMKVSNKYYIKPPKSLVLVAKSFLTTEGTGMIYDPKFNLTKQSKPFIKDIMLKRFSPNKVFNKVKDYSLVFNEYFNELPKLANSFLTKFKDGNINVKLDQGDLAALQKSNSLNSEKKSFIFLVCFLFLISVIVFFIESSKVNSQFLLSKITFTISILLLMVILAIFLKDINS
jgi:ubiquinone biosynthesis protein